VVGIRDQFRGQVPLGLIVLAKSCSKSDDQVIKEVIEMVRERIGPVAFFKKAVVVSKLPKTRSGKVLRSTLRSLANGNEKTIPATCEDPSAIDEAERIIKEHADK
jgi:propionyl-CoA synthetase